MKLASRDQGQFWEKQRFRLFRLRKRIFQRWRYKPAEPKTVLLIAGCQRSGTSMAHHLFRLDRTSVSYDEYSPLSLLTGEEPLRWRPASEVVARIAADRAPFVVAKPLVESQRLRQWLDAVPNSRAIWMFRDVRDVVSSSMKYFSEGIGHSDLMPIVNRDEADWRYENLSDDVAELIGSLWHEDLVPADAAALFWYARNSLFFSGGLDTDRRVALCYYNDLVSGPDRVIAAAYNHLGLPYPGDHIVADVFSSSKGKGGHITLSAPIATACDKMMSDLNLHPRL